MELDLTKEQREVCDVLLDCRDSQNLEYADFSYIAGLYDALRILVVLFPDRNSPDKNPIVIMLLSQNSIRKAPTVSDR